MALYTCYYYKKANGRVPAKEFINSLDINTRSKFFFKKALLEHYGAKLPRPHASYLKDDIFELRFQGQEGHIRVLYFFTFKKRIILTNGFKKKSNKTPENELSLAIESKKDFLDRHVAK